MADLDIAALRKRYEQLLGDGAAERWHDFGDQRYEASYAFSMKGADWKLAAVAVNALPALLDAAEERDRLLTNQQMIMGRIGGYDECPDDPVAAVMHVADCFDLTTGVAAMVVSDRDAWKHKANSLGGELNQCRGYCTPHPKLAEPDIETTPDAVRRNFLDWRERFALVNDALSRREADRDALRAQRDALLAAASYHLEFYVVNGVRTDEALRAAIRAAKETK